MAPVPDPTPQTDDHPAAERVIVLGAGRAASSGLPAAVVDVDERSRVLDWQLDAFAALDEPEIWFVAGYRAEEIGARYPGLRTVLNREWEHTGPAWSLALVPPATGAPSYLCYSDVVFRSDAVAALRSAAHEVVLAVDTSWRWRYEARSPADLDRAEKVLLRGDLVAAIGTAVDTATADAEFTGIARLGPRAVGSAVGAITSGALPPTATIPDLVEYLRSQGIPVHAIDIEGNWAELNARQDLARFVLGTKAESLARLRGRVASAVIDPLVSFTDREWRTDPHHVVDRILRDLPGRRLIVRSSALSEDGWAESLAGAHASILDVERTPAAVTAATTTVLASYRTQDPKHQVLVQEMLSDVALSGVVMTRTHAIGAPYYVANFDDSSGSTDTVTGGAASRTVLVHRPRATDPCPLPAGVPAALEPVLGAAREVEGLVGHDSLDIEFAVTHDGVVHLLQVRPIATTHAPHPVDDAAVATALANASRLLSSRHAPGPGLVGTHAVYSVMADWNPAEIIGSTPKRLATSLYRSLITDEVWARQRAEYGYRDVRPCPLLVEVAGHPYVDVRASMNSFVPAALDDDMAGRLVDRALEHLVRHPQLHDKVEFEVAFTCLTFDFDERAQRLRAAGFSGDEIASLRDALRPITGAAIARCDERLGMLADVNMRIDRVVNEPAAPLDKAFHLLDVARRHGTPLFAHLARDGFVATSLLRSAVATGLISATECERFLAGVTTVLTHMRNDGTRVAHGELAWDEFVARYGHLRPGTYDITSPCYAAAPEAYLRPLVASGSTHPSTPSESLPGATRARVAEALDGLGLASDAGAFEHFVRRAIAGREEAKFVFTRALGMALEHLAEFGAGLGLSRTDLAHLHLDDLLACRDALVDPRAFLVGRVAEGRSAFSISQAVCLPGLITADDQIHRFEQQASEPNYVTQQVVEAHIVTRDVGPGTAVEGLIVGIPNADPGFDWLLARPIAGLVTMYGGANSHMAVRAAELRLPAAIGVGEATYVALETAGLIRLDCASRTITVVR